MEMVTTMTFELEQRNAPEGNETSISTPTVPEVQTVDDAKKNVVLEQKPEEASPAVEENRSPVQDEIRSPALQLRTGDASLSVNHIAATAETVNVDLANVDLAKVRSALTMLNAAVQEEELQYFVQLEATEVMNAKLKQNVESTVELYQKNDALRNSLDAAHVMLDNMRAEATCQVEALNASLVSKDVELANMQADYNILKQQKEEELQDIRQSMEKTEAELKRLETACTGSNQSANEYENELATLRTDYQTLKKACITIKVEKDDIEQAHEEAKEKWKRLVITMKSEYDNFRASFDNLKVTKREMEETHRIEKKSLETEVAALQSENGSLSAALDSLKICKGVVENEFQEAKATWEASKEALETQVEHLHSELEVLQEAKEALGLKLQDIETRFDESLQAQVKPAQEKLAATEEEMATLKTEYVQLQMKKDAVEDERCSLQLGNEELTKERDGLNDELEKNREDLAALKEQHETLTANYDSKVSECVALRSEIETMEAAKKEIENTFSLIQEEHSSQKEDYERLKPMELELEKCTDDLKALKSILAVLEQDKSDLEKELADTKVQLETQTANANVLQVTLDGTRLRHADEKANLEKKLRKVGKVVETKAEALNMALTKYMKELKGKEKLEKDMVVMRNELTQSKDEEREAAIAKLNEKMEASIKYESEQREAALQSQVAAENKLTLYEKVVAKTKAELLAERCQGDSLRESLDKAEAGRREAETKIEEVTRFLEELTNTKADLLEERCQSDSLRKTIETIEGERHEAATKIDELTNKCEYVNQEADKLRAEVAVAEECKKCMKEDAEQMKAQINSLNQMVAKKIAITTASEEYAESLNQSLVNKIATITLLEAALEAKVEKLEDLEQLVERKDKELAKNTSTISSLAMKVEKLEFLQHMIDSKDKELDLIKSRCEALQTTLDDTEEELEKKKNVSNELTKAMSKLEEANILAEKKNTELQTVQERCEKYQISLKKAESLYMDGVEQIKTQVERKHKAALDDALDRVYVLSQMLTKKEEEVLLMHERLRGGDVDVESDANMNAQAESQQNIAKKLKFLDDMVSSKDGEIQLLKARCADLQASLQKAESSSDKNTSNDTMLCEELALAQEKLLALNSDIAVKELMLKSVQTGDEGEFEIVLDPKSCNSRQELEAELATLRARCKELEGRAANGGTTSVVETEQLMMRCKDLEESMAILKKQYEEECERRKEAEQVFSSIAQKASHENNIEMKKPPRSIFSRSKLTLEPKTDTGNKAAGSRWLSLRGRRQKEEMMVRTHTVESSGRDDWRSQYSGSPRRRGTAGPAPEDMLVRTYTADSTGRDDWRSQYSGSPRRRGPALAIEHQSPRTVGGDGVLSQIPNHIQNNFNEVGVYKQRLSNTYLPVLCLGPNDIPAGPVRDDWVSKIGKSKVQNIGVYYYGRKDDDAYATVPWFAFIPYSKAVQRGLDNLPRVILEKLEYGEELTAEEKQIHDGMEAMKEAASKSKAERTHPKQHLAVPKCIVTELPESEDDAVSEMGV
jgi:chromosome segregation ATPase